MHVFQWFQNKNATSSTKITSFGSTIRLLLNIQKWIFAFMYGLQKL